MTDNNTPPGTESQRRLCVKPVPAEDAGARLDRWAADNIEILVSRKAAYKAAKAGRLCIDGASAAPNAVVQPGMSVELYEADQKPPPVYAFDLAVHWEDDVLAVVEKPAGIPVSGNYSRTVERALPHNLRPSESADKLSWPRPVHRLDAPTGGLLLTAKTASATMDLSKQFEKRSVSKRYIAIVTGLLQGEGIIDTPLGERDAVTHYAALKHIRSLHTEWLTLLELKPITGRTHQLRQHLAGLGHPIAGDRQYGTPGCIYKGKGLFLWAVFLRFQHPETQETIQIAIDPPHKFEAYLQREQRRWQKTPRKP